MEWIALTSPEELARVDEASRAAPVLLFKHSTSCGVSAGALEGLERDWRPVDDVHTVFFIDLWAHRDVSDAVEVRYGVRHESPQVLVVDDGACVYTASHRGIRHAEVVQALNVRSAR